MKKWPYADINYLDVEHVRSARQRNDPGQRWENLTVEAVFTPGPKDLVMFFDHYANEHKSQRSELSAYLEALSADGWKLTAAGPIIAGKSYLFRRIQFRRAMA